MESQTTEITQLNFRLGSNAHMFILNQKIANEGGSDRLRIKVVRSADDYLPHMALPEEMHGESEIGKRFRFDREQVTLTIDKMLQTPRSTVILAAESKGEVVGFVVCSVAPFISARAALIGYVQLLYIAQLWRKSIVGGRALVGLINSTVSWAKKKQVVELRLELAGDMMNGKLLNTLSRAGSQRNGISLSSPIFEKNSSFVNFSAGVT